eukprot:TRINITY_DN1414_c0_g1_i2.p1 TRINITY_DN1414_c0_g1~~TRINITY_DN1414_c0_g1_i2.p1  ORF type:complete len:134 (-),score=20.16 TRINITY_DN1414_c0_g1_i2:24-425(-)
MTRGTTVILIVMSIIVFASATCWTSGPYHVASKAFAIGVGSMNSSSVCVYGSNKRLNRDCNLACQGIIEAVWGDCYCRDPDYYPDVSDPVIRKLTVGQIFQLLATDEYYPAASCRDWLNSASNRHMWTCSENQ